MCNIIVNGGTSKMKGFVQRMQQKIVKLLPEAMSQNVTVRATVPNATWLGGSFLATFTTFQQLWQTREV